jgi:hypothetical protein
LDEAVDKDFYSFCHEISPEISLHHDFYEQHKFISFNYVKFALSPPDYKGIIKTLLQFTFNKFLCIIMYFSPNFCLLEKSTIVFANKNKRATENVSFLSTKALPQKRCATNLNRRMALKRNSRQKRRYITNTLTLPTHTITQKALSRKAFD